MPTVNVTPRCVEHLQEIADVLAKSKKVVVVTGAGISTNCGIPDFRSENGLYSMIQAEYAAATASNESQVSSAVLSFKDSDHFEERSSKRRKLTRAVSMAALRTEGSHRSLTRKASLSVASSQDITRNSLEMSLTSSPTTSFNAFQPVSSSQSLSNISAVPTSSQTARQSLPNLKGKDLFDSMIWADETTTSIFYTFISTLRKRILEDVTTTTKTHKFLRTLRDGGRLVRVYTQNIDGLESREGLEMDMEKGPGSRNRFGPKTIRNMDATLPESGGGTRGGDVNTGVEVVQLHGGLDSLRCGLCLKLCEWDDERHISTSAGAAPNCPYCSAASAAREHKGRRSVAIGRLRPDIVLYGEEHPCAHQIGPLITHDISLGPEVLLILGTSLRVHGLKVMVKEFAKAVHAKGGIVVFVNNTKPPDSIWGEVIDFWIESDCDQWVDDLKARKEEVWLPQTRTMSEDKEICPKSKTTPRNPRAVRIDYTNGAYITSEIHRMLKERTTSAKETVVQETQSNEAQISKPSTRPRISVTTLPADQIKFGLLSRPPIRAPIKSASILTYKSYRPFDCNVDRQLPISPTLDDWKAQFYMTPTSGNRCRHAHINENEEQLPTPPGSDEPTLPPQYHRNDSPLPTSAEIKHRMSIGNLLSSSSPLSMLNSDQVSVSEW